MLRTGPGRVGDQCAERVLGRLEGRQAARVDGHLDDPHPVRGGILDCFVDQPPDVRGAPQVLHDRAVSDAKAVEVGEVPDCRSVRQFGKGGRAERGLDVEV
jgi:hypothetical protein